MQQFVHWVNRTLEDSTAPVIRAAVAHLYFESLHPFSDGNGRLGRALVSKIVAQHAGTFAMIPFSVGLFAHRKGYYAALHAASSTLEVTGWIKAFGGMLEDSLHSYEEELAFQIRLLCLLSALPAPLLPRQRKVMDRMAREGAKGFAGGMSAAKYLKIAGTSKATATRDLAELTRLGLLARRGKGTAVRYDIPSPSRS
jgi:Fic family protein